MVEVLTKITGIFMVTAIFLTNFFGSTSIQKEKDDLFAYLKHMEESTIYECSIEEVLNQKELYGIIKNHFEFPLSDGKLKKKCILIGYDGARADVINFRGENGAVNYLSNLGTCKLSYAGGVNVPFINIQQTSTAPGWCSILTGELGLKNGVTGNGMCMKKGYESLVTSLITSGKADKTSFFTSWDGHFIDKISAYHAEMVSAQEKGINANYSCLADDRAVMDGAIAEITDPDGSDFIFAILEACDHTGHTSGFSYFNPEYQNAFTQSDNDAMEIINNIKDRENYDLEDWLIIVTSDHGGIRKGHGGASIQERITFIVANKEF